MTRIALTRDMCGRLQTCAVWMLIAMCALSSQPCSLPTTMASALSPPDYSISSLRQKRIMGDNNRACSLCFSLYDRESCWRCWNSLSPIIPFYASKRTGVDQGLTADKRDRGVQSFIRVQKGSGCGCCFHSRGRNQYCCQACRATRHSKRSGDVLQDQLLSTRHSKRSGEVQQRQLLSGDCHCCSVFHYRACCRRCVLELV